MNWTRDRVRRLADISARAASLSADLQALTHELSADDHGKEKLVAANEELHQAEQFIDAALEPASTIWQLTEALGDVAIERDIKTILEPNWEKMDAECSARLADSLVLIYHDFIGLGFGRDADPKGQVV
jgi:hypothetical protein